ncbi:hypothetical protein [Duffyella gerundensis]|uniref:hypothetical protein n=1 Tax=Duffyella TaxID=3026546 RepID=UPI003F6E31EA
MMNNLPSLKVYTLFDLNIDIKQDVKSLSNFIINRLYASTLNGIISAFNKAIVINPNGAIFINISYLHTLLRTNRGTANVIWQDGIPGYVTGVDSREIGDSIYITGSDFIGLVDARLQTTIGVSTLYLQYIQAAYYTITSHAQIRDVRVTFIHTIEKMRTTLKNLRIKQENITRCEFTNQEFNNVRLVEFAHVNGVANDPEKALDVNNGVIILKEIHDELTRLQIQDYAGMYKYCLQNGYSTVWAENYI